MSKKAKYNIIISIILIAILIISSVFFIISWATDETGVTKVTDETQKKELLGFTDGEDLGILGIASKYSVFVKEDLTVNAADSEGKIAVGGALTANTNYRYQAGCEYDNYSENSKEAKIVVGKGPIKNVATDFGWNNETNLSYQDNKNVSVNTGFNYAESMYKDLDGNDVQYDLSVYKEANLFDFDEQFEYLNSVSQKLKGMTNASVINPDKYGTRSGGPLYKDYVYKGNDKISLSSDEVTVFKGNNEKINVFTITMDQYNLINNHEDGGDIVFDVPYGSYCVINVVGAQDIKFENSTHEHLGAPEAYYTTEIYYPISDEEIANNNMNKEDIAYINERWTDDDSEGGLMRDEEGNFKLFHRISPSKIFSKDGDIVRNVDINNPSSKYILWNLPDATSFDLTKVAFFVGSILAPNADGRDTNSDCKAQISGTMICKSYTGSVQFGYIPFDLSLAKVNINVKDKNNTSISGAELKLYDLKTDDNGELILNDKTLRETYRTTTEEKQLELATGGYILEEYNEADGYKKVENDNYQAFTVNNSYIYIGNKAKTGTFNRTSMVENGFLDKKIKINEESAGPYSHIPTSWGELYNEFTGFLNGSDKTNYSQYRVYKMKCKVHDTRQDKSEKIYYTVASVIEGMSRESKQWTEVEDNKIEFEVPMINNVYDGVDYKNGRFFITFYTGDGKEVKEGVTVSDVYAYWRKGTDGEVTQTFTSKGLETSVSGTIITVLNEKIDKRETKTTSKTYESIGEIFSLNDNKMTVTNSKISGTIKVTKNDTDNNAVEGVEFGLYKDGEDIALETKTTGADGIVSFEELPEGNYIVKELSVPDGYILSKEEQAVSIEESKEYNISYINDYTKLKVQKVDEYGNLLENAYIQILDSSNKVIDEWKTDENIHEINKKLKTKESYILREKVPPTGFTKAEDIPFTVTDEGKIIANGEETEQIIVENKTLKGEINITKLGETIEEISEANKLEKYKVHIFRWKENPLGNVTYDLYAKNDIIVNGTKIYSKDEKIDTITTGFDGIANYSGLPVGDYYVIEKSAPNQYEIDNTKYDISLIVTYDEDNNQKLVAETNLVNERKKETIELTKTEKDSDIPVKGAIYGLYNVEAIGKIAENTLLDIVITNDSGKAKFDIDLPIGNYYVKELESPDGYVLSEERKDINFNESTDFKISVEDELVRVNIVKTDKDGNIIEGAKLQIVDKDGNIIVPEFITSIESTEIIKTLSMGKTYILQEINAPTGYATAKDIEFTVESPVQEVTMVDNKVTIEISKQDITTGEELIGAELTLETIDGEVIDKWISTDKPHEINGILVVGESYRLTEEIAPEGYTKSESIEFKVEDTEEVQKVEMKDDYTKVKVEKIDEKDKYLKGAELQIINENGEVIEKWTTDNNAHEINKKLIAGETYKLQEITAPNGYKKAEDMTFKVSEDGAVDAVRLVNIKEKTKVSEVTKNIIQGALPKTGDIVIIYIAIVAVASGVIVFIIIRKKSTKKENSINQKK